MQNQTWRVGDTVVATTNYYDPKPPHQRLFTNGETGIVSHVERTRFSVRFEGHVHTFPARTKDVLHGFALTVHRCQGSEAPHAIAVIDMFEDYQSRESLYTAATRGKLTATIYGEASRLNAALVRTTRTERHTLLAKRLERAYAKRGREE